VVRRGTGISHRHSSTRALPWPVKASSRRCWTNAAKVGEVLGQLGFVPLLVEESSSAAIRALLGDDPAVWLWQLAGTEVTSALWRRRRADEIDEVVRRLAEAGLAVLEGLWTAVEDTPLVDRRAAGCWRCIPYGQPTPCTWPRR